MLRNGKFAVGFVTVYLLVYIELLQFENMEIYGFAMLLFAPFLICWMVYTVLKYGKYSGPELGEEEFGYQDKQKDQLGVF